MRDTSVRPDEFGCRVQMWKAGFGLGKKADCVLTLTEFANHEGKATYFRPRDDTVAINDIRFTAFDVGVSKRSPGAKLNGQMSIRDIRFVE